MRGLIICPPIVVVDGGLEIESSDLDADELRTSLLFWDKLDFPTGMYHFDGGQDAQFLEAEGILTRTKVPFSGSGGDGEIFRRMFVDAFAIREESDPGAWSVHTGERGLSFKDDELVVGRGLLVSLHHALPVPKASVPLNDVLQFRSDRRDELLALRHHLEAIYSRIQNAGDGPLTKRSELEALDLTIRDYMRTAKEADISWKTISLDAEMNVLPMITAGAGALALGTSLFTAALVAAAGSLSITVGHSLRGRANKTSPFRYVSRYHGDFA